MMTPQEIEIVTEMFKDEVRTQSGSYYSLVQNMITDVEYTAFAIKVLRRIDEMRKPIPKAIPRTKK